MKSASYVGHHRVFHGSALNELTYLDNRAVDDDIAAVFAKDLSAHGKVQAGATNAFDADEMLEDVDVCFGAVEGIIVSFNAFLVFVD